MLGIYAKAAQDLLEEQHGIISIFGVEQVGMGYVFSTNKGLKALSQEDMAVVHSKVYLEG
jgi:hypothetical protein